MEHSDWTGRTDGTPWMQRALIAIFRYVDVRLMYVPMAFVVPFYMLFSRRSYRAIYDYYRHSLNKGPLRAFCGVYANHFAFGKVVLDRFALYAGRKFSSEIEGNDHFLSLVESGKGGIILGSHTGNFEICGYLLHSKGKRLNAVVSADETKTVQAARSRLWGHHNIGIITVSDDLSHIFDIHAALRRGELVCLASDRVFGSAKTTRQTLLDRPADFPIGPFAIAASLHVPVLTLFVMKEPRLHYRIFVQPLADETTLAAVPRKSRPEFLASNYVAHLDRMVRRYPNQWFNYYDFWRTHQTD